MNKSVLITSIASKANLSNKQGSVAIDALISPITEVLKVDDTVALLSFGTFEMYTRAVREGRYSVTGEKKTISTAKAPGFKAGKG